MQQIELTKAEKEELSAAKSSHETAWQSRTYRVLVSGTGNIIFYVNAVFNV